MTVTNVTYPFSLMPLALAPLARDHERDIRDGLATHGRLAGHYTVLGPDPWRVMFSADRQGFCFFLDAAACVMVWRSPVGPRSARRDALAAVLAYAARRRRGVFVIQCDDETRDDAVHLGMSTLWIGSETFVDLPQWSLEGGRRQKIRWATSHARKAGVTFQEIHPLVDLDGRRDLVELEEAWKDERHERRTDSFLRNDALDLVGERRYFVARHDGRTVASVTCTPLNDHGWYLQDIVRRPDAERGALEGAMAHALSTLRDDGFTIASNGPLPLWSPDSKGDPLAALGPLGRRIFPIFDKSFRFSGINQFRSKIEPDTHVGLHVAYTKAALAPWSIWSLTRLLQHRDVAR